MAAETLWRKTLDLVYPMRCAGCGRFDTPLCRPCTEKLEPATGPGRCGHCSARWEGSDFCPRCLHLHDLAGVRAAFEMDGPARQLVHNLKYRRYRALAEMMAGHLREVARHLDIDTWYAVPLHRSRLRERGFNQAGELLLRSGLPGGPGLLARVRKTDRQVGQHVTERRQNVAGAFAYSGPSLAGRRVAVLDDVVTTGATVRECATVLRDAGARDIWAVGFARTSYKPGTDGIIPD